MAQEAEPGSAYARRVWLATLIAGGAVAAAFLVWKAAQMLLLVFAGILLAILLHRLVVLLCDRTPLSRASAFAVVVVVFFVFVGLSAWVAIPIALQGWETATSELPKAANQLEVYLAGTDWGDELMQRMREGLAGGTGMFSSMMGRLAGMFSTLLGAVIGVLVVMLIGIYGAWESSTYHHAVLKLVPPPRRPRADVVLAVLRSTLLWWIVGRALSMVVVAVLTGVGLWLLDIPLALALALLAGLLSFIPNLGPLLSAVPAVLMGLAQGPWSALHVVLLYMGVQTVESYFITPMIQLRAVSLPPAVMLTVQLFFGTLFGFLGVFLATPLAVAGIVLVKLLYIEGVLGDDVELAIEKH